MIKISQKPLSPTRILNRHITETIVEVMGDKVDGDVIYAPRPTMTISGDECTKHEGYVDRLLEIYEENKALTPTQRTLKLTFGKYDTIIVANEGTKEIIEHHYGELNIKVSSHVEGIVMVNLGGEDE